MLLRIVADTVGGGSSVVLKNTGMLASTTRMLKARSSLSDQSLPDLADRRRLARLVDKRFQSVRKLAAPQIAFQKRMSYLLRTRLACQSRGLPWLGEERHNYRSLKTPLYL